MKYFLTILIIIAFSGVSNAQEKAIILEKKMVTVRAGDYKPFFITNNNKPIPVEAFKMDETTVTNAEFLEFVKANPQWRRAKVNRLFADTNYLRHWKVIYPLENPIKRFIILRL